MAIVATDLANFVGAGSEDTAFVTSCLSTAKDLVDDFVGDSEVPTSILERCYLAVGSELFHVRNAPNAISQYSGDSPIRIARDPMVAARPLLQQYVVFGV